MTWRCNVHDSTQDIGEPCDHCALAEVTAVAPRAGFTFAIRHVPDIPPPNLAAQAETTEADRYKGQGGYGNHEPCDRHCYATLPMLTFLNGQPWDAMALNYVDAIRPEAVRVLTVDDNGHYVVNSDAIRNRVTVILESDGRTIRSIEQELSPGARGVHCGAQLDRHRKKREES